MGILSHLLDTSVLTRLRHPAVRHAVDSLAAAGQAARAGISDLEIGFSARHAAEWDGLLGALDAFVLVETTARHVKRARQVQRLLAAQGRRGRKVPDLLVAAAAEEMGVTLLHYDADFDQIAMVTGQSCRWVLPPGTVD